jgi:C-terminal processing protease CtpA/Prc
MNQTLRVAGVLLCLVIVVYGIRRLSLNSPHPSRNGSVAQTVQSAITNSVGFAKLHVTGGIGADVFADSVSGLPEINNLAAGSPAERAGLREGDRILEINGVATRGRMLAQNIEGIRGFAIGSVGLTIQRAGSTNLNFVIHRSSWSSISAGQ